MKRFWLSLLSLGLVMAFSVSAFAVDVKVGAEYYAAGMYLSQVQLAKGGSDHSTAFYFQRLRVGTDFIISPSLSFVTRFDAMERVWGGNREYPWVADEQSAGTRTENENIAFDLAYIKYISPIGLFEVGYQPDYVWGTVFENRASGDPQGMITWGAPIGPVTVVAQMVKEYEGSSNAINGDTDATDTDYDSYRVGAIYKFNNSKAKGEVGGLVLYERIATGKDSTYAWPYPPAGVYDVGYLINVYKVIPYFKAQIGPVALQGEFDYTFGKLKFEDPGNPVLAYMEKEDTDVAAWSVFLDATADFGMFYAGGSFVYLSGDDPATDEMEGGLYEGLPVNTAGLDWNPCLILFNNDLRYWGGTIYGSSDSELNNEMSNAIFVQGRVGVKPNPKTDIMLAISYATVDEKPLNYDNGDYGWEIDLTGTYKITNNLTYTLGAGYLFTGDYFKGTNDTDVYNEYMLINKLTLSF